jgi:hypothetical protein
METHFQIYFENRESNVQQSFLKFSLKILRCYIKVDFEMAASQNGDLVLISFLSIRKPIFIRK